MDESQSFRRAFLAGLLTLGVAVSGEMATSKLETSEKCTAPASYVQRSQRPEVRFVQVEPQTGLAERVARAVIGAVLNGFA